MSAPKWKHRPCPCGCGELADECMRPSSGLNAFQITDAPSAARALRWFADERVHNQTPGRMEEDLHAAADEIEATP